MKIAIRQNAIYFGESLLIVVLWISTWSLVELTVDKFVPSYTLKMILYLMIFIVTSIIILLFANEFYQNV